MRRRSLGSQFVTVAGLSSGLVTVVVVDRIVVGTMGILLSHPVSVIKSNSKRSNYDFSPEYDLGVNHNAATSPDAA